jgi:hypothetical protein
MNYYWQIVYYPLESSQNWEDTLDNQLEV